ncbi:SLAM family member 5 isoform X2 [Fukomys damarensis]|uniref:SLAM family member 5 isoform X2 n=1 Tax=Fukomys damarensis TaxID=885580 RepID=UPI00053FF95B|nr:SLAM family member 5 isoform X2 [Fukomys damarensis]
MAQHHLRFLLLCLQTWLTATGKDADLFMNGILGESVAFPLNIQNSKEVQSIAWTSESSVAVITPGDSGKAPTIIVTHNNYKGRIKVIQKNYDLVISDLKMEDAGKYKADITINSTTTKIYYLHVFRRLGKPKITQSLMTSMNGTCNVTLTCSVEKEEKNVSYSWNSLETESNVLQVIQTPGNQGLNYTCTAQNPVSNNSSSISSQQLCADITTDSHTHHTGLLSGLAIIFLAVLILPAVLLCHLRKRKQDAASENIIYTCAKVSKDTQPAEAKIYDEISQSKVSPSKDESLKTIYSTVQYPAGMKKTKTLGNKPPKVSGYEMVI